MGSKTRWTNYSWWISYSAPVNVFVWDRFSSLVSIVRRYIIKTSHNSVFTVFRKARLLGNKVLLLSMETLMKKNGIALEKLLLLQEKWLGSFFLFHGLCSAELLRYCSGKTFIKVKDPAIPFLGPLIKCRQPMLFCGQNLWSWKPWALFCCSTSAHFITGCDNSRSWYEFCYVPFQHWDLIQFPSLKAVNPCSHNI